MPGTRGGRYGQSADGAHAPFRGPNYRRLIAFLASWSFATNLAAPFFTVHMLKRMELDLTWVIGFGTLSQLAAFVMTTGSSRNGSIPRDFNRILAFPRDFYDVSSVFGSGDK